MVRLRDSNPQSRLRTCLSTVAAQLAIGARCNNGYAVVEGAGCDTCCKRGQTYPAGSNCTEVRRGLLNLVWWINLVY